MANQEQQSGVRYVEVDCRLFREARPAPLRRGLVALGTGRRRGHLGRFLGLELRPRRRRLRRPVHRHADHHRALCRHVLLDRRDDSRTAAHGRRLLVRPLGDGAVGRLHHGPGREHGVRADARGRDLLHRQLSRRDLRHPGIASRRSGGSWATSCSSGSTSGASRRRSASRCSSRRSRWRRLACSGSGRCRCSTSTCCSTSRRPRVDSAWLPFGASGILLALPFAIWFYLAIEQLPLAAEEAHQPARDLPKGILLGLATLVACAFLTLFLNCGHCPRLRRPPGLRRAGARRLPHDLRRGCRSEGARAGRCRRPDRELPHDHFRLRPQHLFVVAARATSRTGSRSPTRPARRRTWR